MASRTRQEPVLGVSYTVLVDSFERTLWAENKSPKTVAVYLSACSELLKFLTAMGMPLDVEHIRREHVEAFIADQLARLKPNSALNRYRSLKVFFKWMVEEGELKVSPMANMRPPFVPEELPGVLTEGELSRLLKTVSGRSSFEDVRDNAILRLMNDAGMRLAECSEIMLDRIDFTTNTVRVTGKGRRERPCSFGRKTAQAVDRYLRMRMRHKDAGSPYLWLGKQGRLTSSGMFQVVKRRGEKAGLTLHPHLFRHTFASRWMGEGGSETDLMALAGWRSRTMLSRYGASAAATRAHAAHARLGLMDRL